MDSHLAPDYLAAVVGSALGAGALLLAWSIVKLGTSLDHLARTVEAFADAARLKMPRIRAVMEDHDDAGT